MAMVSLRVWFLTAFILWLKICHSYGQTFRVTQTSNESITVAWESVTTLVNFSIVLNSTEVYRGSGEAGSPREVVGLKPGSLYHLQVEALHENGTQLVLLNINKFTRPNQAENVETPERNTGSITVTWQGPSRGDLWYYTTKLQEVTSSERNVSKADRRATFTGLNAAGRYTVVIATVIGDETGNVVEKVIYTKPAAPTAALVTAYDTEMIVVTWTPASSNQNEVSFQVSYQVAGSVKTLTSCQVSGCALTMPKPGQSVTVFVVASISGINSDEVTATGNTKPLPPGYMLVSDRNTESLTVTGLLPMLSSVSDNIMVQVTPSPSYPPQHRVSGANYSVTIHGLTPGTRYTITVETVSGRERSNSTVQTFYTRPAKPPAVTRHDTTTDTLTVTWSEPAAGMFTQYAISIRRNGTTTVIKKSKVSKSASRVEKFEGLQPGEMYEIILQTEISSVYSEPATSTFRTKPLKPQNVYVSVRNVNAFTISWEAPSGGTHTGYVAELVGMKTEQKVGGESIEFTELRPGTGYTCVLRTVSGDQMSDPQQDVFYTQPARPKWLNKTDVTSNSTTVEWGRPETGHYDGFRLTLQPDDQEVFLNESETSHRFTLLQSATRYTVKIAAKADTIYSSDVELIFTTRPKPPRNLHVVHQDTSSVGFVWDAPDQAVSVDAYRYTVTKSDSSQQADYVETTGSIHSATSTGLTSGGTYVIKVRAVKSGIESDPTDQLRLTLTPDNPGRLSASNVGQTSIELQWYDQSGDFDGFIVELKLDDTVVNKTQVGRSTKTVEIQDLLPERTYTALVYTVSNGKQSSGTSISVTTMSLGTVTLELEQRSTKSITVGWRQASGKVTHYELQVVPKDGGQTTTVIIQADKPQQHKFKDLQPGQTYVFTISIVASETKGAVSSRDITTKPLAVTSLTAEALDTATLRVQWGVLPDSIQREFQVQYKLQSGTTTNDLPVMYVSGQLTYTQDITSLAAGHTYDITVSAISNHISGAGQTVHNTTRPLPVASLQVEVLSPSVARLAWTGNQDSQQDRYQVRFKGDMLSTQWSSVQNVPDGTETNMTDLTPGDSYLFEVTAYSIDQWSDPVTETATMYPLPPSSVDVVTNETSTSRVKVRWTYEYELKTYWSHWLVIYGRVGSVTTLSQTLRDTGLRTYTVDNLLAGYNYTIQVYTVTLDNVTSLSPTTVDATVKPVITTEMTETVEQTTTDTLALTYTEETGSGTFDHYTFSLQDSPPVVKDRGDLDRTVMFHQLEAGHLYWVVAQTVSGSEISSAKRLKVFTVPHPPEVTCVEEQDWISIVLNQADGSASQFDIVCGSCNDSRHHTIPSDEHSVRFRNLQPFTEYKFDVTSVVGDETTKSSVVRSIRCKTNEGRPQLVQEFSATNIKPYELTLTWREPLVKNGNLKEYIIKYNGSKQYAKDTPTGEIKLNETVHSQTIRSLKAGYTYTFEIRAYNSLSGDPAVLNVTLPVAAPYIALPDIAKATPTVINDSVTKSSFKMEFVNPFSDKNGAIIGYSIVVTTDTQHKDLKVADLPNWAHRKSDNAVLYVAVDKCRDLFSEGNTCWSSGVMKRSAPNDRVVVTVGGDSGCDENAIDPCNGKLSSDTTYYIRLRAYTEGNLFAETPFSKGVTTAVKPVNVVAIVIPVIVCVIFIIVVVVILVLRHRDTFSKKARPECPIFIGTLQQPAHRSKTDDSSRPIKLTDFSKHWKSMNADAQFKFAEEYEDLKEVGREQSITVAELPANRVKNRFSNILPYDSTRVRLLAGDEEEEEEGTDYINASWMPGYNSKREYIVAQGPLPSTRDDMWRVVWEQNVQSIVMLTKCVEKGRDKCDYYWPVDSEPMFYGDVQVMILNETKCTEWVVTEFKISSGGHSRHLKHFHYTAWPDFGVPEKPRSLIGFVRLVRSKLKTTEGPTIVHCSAGVGRSGTFIVLDRMLQHLLEHDYVDVFGTVYEMRKHRHWMVQTEQQYICIHRCLVYVIEDREFDDADSDGEANKAFEIDEGIES